MILLKALAATFAATFAVAAQTWQQTPNPIFKAETNLVPIEVHVTERTTGRPITGLTIRDFVVLDEDNPADIVSFDVTSTRSLDLCLVIDTSGGWTNDAVRVATQAAVRRLVPGDRLGIVSFHSKVTTHEMLTDSEHLAELGIRAALRDRNRFRKTTKLYDALAKAVEMFPPGRHVQQRAILVITHNREKDSKQTEATLLRGMFESDTIVNAIVIPQDVFIKPLGTEIAILGAGSVGRVKQNDTAPSLQGTGGVEPIVQSTGGDVLYYESTKFSEDLNDFMERLRTQYILSIRGADEKGRRFRSLSVRLAESPRERHPNAVIRSRNGYFTIQ